MRPCQEREAGGRGGCRGQGSPPGTSWLPPGVRSAGGRGTPPAQSPGLQVSGSRAWEGRVGPGGSWGRGSSALGGQCPPAIELGAPRPLLTQVSWGPAGTSRSLVKRKSEQDGKDTGQCGGGEDPSRGCSRRCRHTATQRWTCSPSRPGRPRPGKPGHQVITGRGEL